MQEAPPPQPPPPTMDANEEPPKPERPKKRFALCKLRLRLRNYRAGVDKRRSEYLYAHNNNRWRRLLISLHPESLFSFFTSRNGVWFVFKIGFTGVLVFIILIAAAYFYYRREAPTTILELQACAGGRVNEFYDQSGQTLLWTVREGTHCIPVNISDINPYVVQAVISVEDKDFYEHPGIKAVSIGRAIVNNLMGRPKQGGSTITQQYIKNAVLKDSDRSYERKIKEIVLVPEIESLYSKQAILNAYLNTIYLGRHYGGVEAAAQGYFHKSASDLTLDEAALLVASISAPAYIWSNPDLHLRKRNIVLGEMLRDGRINQKEHEEARQADSLAKIQPEDDQIFNRDAMAPHFTIAAEEQFRQLVCQNTPTACPNLHEGGYQIITSLDLDTQHLIEEVIDDNIVQFEEKGFNNVSLLIIDNQSKTVLGLMGGRDFNYPQFGQVNHMSKPKMPGKLLHALIYAHLLDNNSLWGPGRTLYDYETFHLNQELTYQGPVSLRQALAESLLTPTIKAAHLAGSENINEQLLNFNLNNFNQCDNGCATLLALGDDLNMRLDNLSNLYATFASEGKYQALSYIKEIKDGEDRLIYQRQRDDYQAFSQSTAFMINDILSDAAYKPDTLKTYKNLAFKNSFHSLFNDNPFVAYTPQITIGGWIGQQVPQADDPEPSLQTGLETQTTLIKALLDKYTPPAEGAITWSPPAGLQILRTNLTTGQINSATGRSDYYAQDFKSRLLPNTTHLLIDRASQKLAQACTPASAISRLNSSLFVSELPADHQDYYKWINPIWQYLGSKLDSSIPDEEDDLHKCSDEKPDIHLATSGDCLQVCQLTITIQAGTHDLQTMRIKDSDNRVVLSSNISGRDFMSNYEYTHNNPNNQFLEIEAIDRALYLSSYTLTF